MYKLSESRFFSSVIMAAILINTLMLVLSTWRSVAIRFDYYFAVIDGIFMAVYVVECGLKIYVWRAQYFQQGWDILDLVIVCTSLSEMIAPLTVGASTFSGGSTNIFRILRVLRALRSLRVLRTIRFLENIQVILITCLHSFQSLGAILMLMGTFLVIFAVIGRGLFVKHDPKHFGGFGKTCFTLIQLLTLDDWFEIFTGITDVLGYFDIRMFFYLLFYIIIEYFVFLNLFIAVLVDNFQLTLRDKLVKKAEEKEHLENAKKQIELRRKEEDAENSDSDDNFETIRKELLFNDNTSSDEEYVDVEKELITFMDDAADEENLLIECYYRVLPFLEKNYHQHSDYMACHNRIIDHIVDNTDDVIDRN
ncbi:cation channel sperm-associated protein 1-like isoform X2 [Clavelina lepadiformis]